MTSEMDSVLDKYTKEEIEEFREAFSVFDKDGNGSITRDELKAVLTNLGQASSDQEVDDLLNEVDIDGDGCFSFEEFVQMMSQMGGMNGQDKEDQTEEEELRQAFDFIDKTGKGYILATDLRAVLEMMGEELTDKDIDDIIAEVDVDGNGKIDFEEFCACLQGAQCVVTGEKRPGGDDGRIQGLGLRTDVKERDFKDGDRVATDEEIPV